MIAKNFTVKQLRRFPKTGDFDELNFELGVNVLVGEPSTGKTQWLQMLNFLMGAPDIKFDDIISHKYDSVEGVFIIGDKEITLERKWKEAGNKTKVFINEEPVSADGFSSILLTSLNIPILKYPQSNPLSFHKWISLSWRQLLRHIYRRQKSWGELADKQLEIDQHACILLFLGIAEHLFSDKHSQLVEKQKRINTLQIKKDQFVNTLTEISKEILDSYSLLDSVTIECLEASITNLEVTDQDLLKQHDEIIGFLRDAITSEYSIEESQKINQFTERWSELQSINNNILVQKQETQTRLEELTRYSMKIQDELYRLERAKSAGNIFRDLRVTHCPVCEKPVNFRNVDPDHCYLCKQPNLLNLSDSNMSEQRLEFENEQLQEEFKEAQELIDMVSSDVVRLNVEQRTLEEEISFIRQQMVPMQSAAAMVLPPEMFQIDMERGKIYERIRQLNRIKDALNSQGNISEEITNIEKEINTLQNEVNEVEENVDFDQCSNFLTEKMNFYLESIDGWKNQGEISLRIKERSFSFFAGTRKINSLSSTMMMYFLAAYNYGLLSLSNKEQYYYPSFSILEFPPNFVDGSQNVEVRNLENFILQPFIDLLSQEDMQNAQVIAVGRAFEGLENVHRIELTEVWS
jgi:hypothetical protein